MLIFNDVAMESIPGIKIEDIRVSPIEMNAISRQRPIRFGAEFERITGGVRTVTVTFAALVMSREMRMSLLSDVTKWARTDTPGRLYVPGYYDMFLNVVCTQLPEISIRQWWDSRMTVVFTAFEPYWISDEVKTCACGESFYVGGSAPPMMIITRSLAAAAASQSYSDGRHTMAFSSIPAGLMTIDLNRQTADVDGTSIMPAFAYGSEFIEPKTGSMTITGTGTVIWRERWE